MYDDVAVTVETSQTGTDAPNVTNISNAKLWCNYVYLDSHERRLFMQKDIDYIFQQTQCIRYNLVTPIADFGTYVIDISAFNNPVKYIAWVLNDGNFGSW